MQLLIEDVDLGDFINEVIVEQIANPPAVNSIRTQLLCLVMTSAMKNKVVGYHISRYLDSIVAEHNITIDPTPTYHRYVTGRRTSA